MFTSYEKLSKYGAQDKMFLGATVSINVTYASFKKKFLGFGL